MDSGKFKEEIVPVTLGGGRNNGTIQWGVNSLTGTQLWIGSPNKTSAGGGAAGNSSGENDGAPGFVLTPTRRAKKKSGPIGYTHGINLYRCKYERMRNNRNGLWPGERHWVLCYKLSSFRGNRGQNSHQPPK